MTKAAGELVGVDQFDYRLAGAPRAFDINLYAATAIHLGGGNISAHVRWNHDLAHALNALGKGDSGVVPLDLNVGAREDVATRIHFVMGITIHFYGFRGTKG